MPIRPSQRFFYPIDWAELSATIRFERADGACERCGRRHGEAVWHLGSHEVAGRAGLWWDERAGRWRCARGRSVPLRTLPAPRAIRADVMQLAFWDGFEIIALPLRRSVTHLACCHLDHDPTNNVGRNLAALCQRCHLAHDRDDNLARRRSTRAARRGERPLLPIFA